MNLSIESKSELKRLINQYDDDEVCVSSLDKQNFNPFDNKIVTLIKHQIENNLTMRCTAKTAKILNSMSNCGVSLPESEISIKSKMKVSLTPQYFVICRSENIVKNGELCTDCGFAEKKNAKTNNYIVSIPLLPQIQSVLSRNYNKIMHYLNRERELGVITDADDGHSFQNISSKYPNANVLGLTVNIDGANFHRSSKSSLWLTQV